MMSRSDSGETSAQAAIRRRMPPLRLMGGRCGIAMVEAVLATIIIALMTVAALRTIVATRAGQVDAEYRLHAAHLAAELMTEIINKSYREPDLVPVFGPEPGEEDRTDFDDVDDYHGWSESPPQDRDGTARNHLADWERSVEVAWVFPNDVNQVSGVDLGVKRIVVTVRRNGVPLSRLTALRTAAVAR